MLQKNNINITLAVAVNRILHMSKIRAYLTRETFIKALAECGCLTLDGENIKPLIDKVWEFTDNSAGTTYGKNYATLKVYHVKVENDLTDPVEKWVEKVAFYDIFDNPKNHDFKGRVMYGEGKTGSLYMVICREYREDGFVSYFPKLLIRVRAWRCRLCGRDDVRDFPEYIENPFVYIRDTKGLDRYYNELHKND